MKVEVDVVVPVGSRTDELGELHRKRCEALTRAGYAPRFTYVIDGEMPAVRQELERAAETDDSLRIIQLSRRFGQTSAILAGFSHTKAERILILPAYEQVESDALGSVVAALEHADLVTVRRYPRCDSPARRLQSWAFEQMLRLVGASNVRDPGCSVHGLRRVVLEETQLYGEQHGFLPVLAANAGFKVIEINLPQAKRDADRSLVRPRYYFHRVLDVFSVFFLTRFTRRPLRFFGPLGATCAILGALVLAVVIVERLGFGVPLGDRPALLLGSLMLAVGLQILAIGLIGELIVFIHARSMKQYRIAEVVEATPGVVSTRPTHLTPVGTGD
jgi:hypothetical protein